MELVKPDMTGFADALNKNKISHYDFFQLVFLLEKFFVANKKQLEQEVDLLPDESLSFPATDVKTSHRTTTAQIILQLSFMGLYGVDSPLPHYFLSQSLSDNENSKRIRGFLDVLNKQLYFLYYRAWQKYHPFSHINEDSYLEYLIALSGNSLNLTDQQEFSYANMFNAKMRNIANLKYMLQIYLKEFLVSIYEFVPEWVEADNAFFLGDSNLGLGQNTLLGERVIDVNGRVDIEIGPMLIEESKLFFPEKEQGKRLIHILHRYIGQLLEFRVVFLLLPNQQKCSELGNNLLTLAWDTWLGQPLKQPHSRQVYSSKLAQSRFND